jgi:hypothetical protein
MADDIALIAEVAKKPISFIGYAGRTDHVHELNGASADRDAFARCVKKYVPWSRFKVTEHVLNMFRWCVHNDHLTTLLVFEFGRTDIRTPEGIDAGTDLAIIGAYQYNYTREDDSADDDISWRVCGIVYETASGQSVFIDEPIHILDRPYAALLDKVVPELMGRERLEQIVLDLDEEVKTKSGKYLEEREFFLDALSALPSAGYIIGMTIDVAGSDSLVHPDYDDSDAAADLISAAADRFNEAADGFAECYNSLRVCHSELVLARSYMASCKPLFRG